MLDNRFLETLDIILPSRERGDGSGEENFSGFELVKKAEDFKVEDETAREFFGKIRSILVFTWDGAVCFVVAEPKYLPRSRRG